MKPTTYGLSNVMCLSERGNVDPLGEAGEADSGVSLKGCRPFRGVRALGISPAAYESLPPDIDDTFSKSESTFSEIV